MFRDAARSLLAEPRVPDPPVRVWRDWALVAALVPVAVLEGVLKEDLVWRVASVVVALALLLTLLWRRTHPLAAVMVAFGLLTVVHAVPLVVGVDWRGLDTSVFVVFLLVYSLFRWGSGRDAAIGMVVLSVPVLLSGLTPLIHESAEGVPASDLVGGGLFVLVVAAVGVAVRYQAKAQARGMDQVKLLEREQLARELHDTVAHHVSAIAIRAQAGRVVASSDPAAALDALVVIEEEASRTLSEMRAMVGALRHGEEPDLAPQRGVADIERLITVNGDRPHIHLELSGDLDGLRPSVDAALYRLAQESITNAVRHARRATRIKVTVSGDDDCVRLTVGDDGDAGAFDPRSASGFGLIGMAERAKLLGGTLEAGPNRNRGWTVHAVLPRARRGGA
ncbi:MAG TPA: sensor histidine kinase [Acidimicrobiales bacterium]|nr:sensor histidine kinase [Acidimicrobiales bacterium]